VTDTQTNRSRYVRHPASAAMRPNIVPEDGDVGVVGVLVDAHDEHGCVSRRRGDDDLLAAAFDVQLSLLDGREDAGRLDHVLDAALAPRDLSRIFPTPYQSSAGNIRTALLPFHNGSRDSKGFLLPFTVCLYVFSFHTISQN